MADERATYFAPPEAEDEFWRRLERLRIARSAAASMATPAAALQAGALRAYYPWLPPEATLSLAKAGVRPESPAARTAARAAARRKTKSRGLGWNTVGDVVSAGAKAVSEAADFVAPEAVEDAVGATLAVAGGVARPAVRTAVTAFATPLEEAQGLVRNVAAMGPVGSFAAGAGTGAGLGSLAGPFGALAGGIVGGVGGLLAADEVEGDPYWGLGFQSSGGIALGRLARGQRVDLGTGYFPGGEIAKAQSRAARHVQVDGQALTPGRLLAAAVLEPGSRPYKVVSGLVDAAVVLRLDPANVGFGAATAANRARKVFTAGEEVASNPLMRLGAGLVEGRRPSTIPEQVDQWLGSKAGREVVEAFAGEASVDAIWKAANKKMPVDVAVRLADAGTPDEVRDVIRAAVAGGVLRNKPTVGGFGAVVRRRLDGVRLAQMMPGDTISLDDIDDAVEQLDRFQKNAKLGAEAIAENNTQLARALVAGNRQAAYETVVRTVGRSVRDELVARGVARAEADWATKFWRDSDRTYTKYFVDEIGDDAVVPGVVLGGEARPVPTPHLFVEYVQRAIPLPDAREIRRATGVLAPLYRHAEVGKLLREGTALADFLQGNAWKRLVLLRGAWTTRVVGEEQIRMAQAGLANVFTHPLSAIARLVSDESPERYGRFLGDHTPANLVVGAGRAVAGALDAAGVGAGKGRTGVLGDVLTESEEARGALMRGSMGFVDRGTIRTKYKTLVRRGDRRFVDSWAEELGQLAADPVAKRVAGGWSPGDAVPGGMTGNHVEDARRWFWSGAGKKFRLQMADEGDRAALATDKAVADAYIDSVWRRITIKTGEHPDLLDAVATGKLAGAPLDARAGDPRAAIAQLRALADEGVGPDVVKGDLVVTAKGDTPNRVAEMWTAATDTLMNALMARPSNYLSRSRTFEQFYWRRQIELAPLMDEATQAKVLDAARAANLDGNELAALRKAASRGAGQLDAATVDLLGKSFALDETKRLLFDLSNRSQWTDVLRIAAPFAEAWKELLTVWARLGIETGGKPLRRVHQVVEGARGAGFFYPDPVTGEETFAYPGTELLTGAVVGMPVPLTGRVASLNLFSSNPLLPGLGPMVQFPLSKILPERPEWDWLRELVAPYGEPDTGGGFVEAFLPAWYQKFRAAFADPDNDRLLANTVMDAARWLVSTGKYSTRTVAEQERLSAKAIEMGRKLYALRGAAQFVAPAAPSPQMVAVDKDGRVVTAVKLTEEFRRLQDEDYETAVQRFLDTFGEDALLYTQAKTRGGFTPTDRLHNWVRRHPDQVRRFRDVYGWFVPGADGGEFSLSEYDRQLAVGERDALTPDEAVKLANHRVADAIYRQARAKADPKNRQHAEWLRDVREQLVEEYPGYEPGRFDPTRVPKLMRQLAEAAADPVLRDTEVGRGLVLYLEARDKAMAAAKALGLASFGRAKKARHLRTWLRDVAATIAAEHDGFGRLFDEALSREMVDDEPEAPAAAPSREEVPA